MTPTRDRAVRRRRLTLGSSSACAAALDELTAKRRDIFLIFLGSGCNIRTHFLWAAASTTAPRVYFIEDLGALGAALTTKEPPWEPLSSAFKRLLERLTAGLFFTRHKYGDFYGDLGSVPRNFPFLSCYVFQSRTGDGNVALGPTLACMHARCSVGPRLGLREPCPRYRYARDTPPRGRAGTRGPG